MPTSDFQASQTLFGSRASRRRVLSDGTPLIFRQLAGVQKLHLHASPVPQAPAPQADEGGGHDKELVVVSCRRRRLAAGRGEVGAAARSSPDLRPHNLLEPGLALNCLVPAG